MKTIFAATDFTPAAQNAVYYAASIAREFKARLVLFSAFDSTTYPTAEVSPEIIEDARRDTELALGKEAAALQQSYDDIVIEKLCREGAAASEIINAASETGADIIVMGMKETGRAFRKIFGSAVTALSRKSDLPLLVVPESVTFLKMDTIALANDQDAHPETDPHLLDMMLELGNRFSSKLYLVRIAKNHFHESYEVCNRPLRLIRMAQSLAPVYECFEGRNEEKSLGRFVKEYNIDMLVLLPHYHSLADRWLAKSTTRTMVFDSRIPLLILPGLRMQERN